MLCLWALLVLGMAGIARGVLPSVVIAPISVGELQAPVCITHAGDGSGRLFICEQAGQVRIIQDGMLQPQVFLDLSARIVPLTSYYDERGLLSLAFHPGFATASSPGYRRFYVFYSAPSPNAAVNPPVNCRSTISEFQVSATTGLGDPATERVLLSFDKPQDNHNGGQLAFGPDGYLYISTGDGGGADDDYLGHNGGTNPATPGNLGNAQDTTSLLGKILCIDPLGTNGPGGQYGIPVANPFSIPRGSVRTEIFAFGFRNVWRFSFDTGTGGTGKLFAADVGQSSVEEVDIVTAGANFGWHAREGAFTFDSAVENALINGGSVRVDGGTQSFPGGAVLTGPIAQYAHPNVTIGSPALPQLGTAIIGGVRYRGAAFPALSGKYVFSDYASGSDSTVSQLLGIEETAPNVWSTPAVFPVAGTNPLVTTHVLALGRDEKGELYIATEMASGPQNNPANGKPSGGIYLIAPVAVTKSITAAKDNTIFSEDAVLGTSTSDGQGHLYAGRTGSNYGPYNRRALMSFDVASQVPAGVVIQSAQLQLNLAKASFNATGKTLSLYRLSETWGEGTSVNLIGGYGAPATTGDATWQRRFYNTSSWTTAGGTHSATLSASVTVPSTTGLLTWGSTSQMVSDVQGWLDTPSGNAGWILFGNETAVTTACQFDSVQTAPQDGVQPPTLVVTYPASPLTRHQSWIQQYFAPGHYVDDLADLDGDGLRNLAEYAFAFNPLAANVPGSGLQVSTSRSGTSTLLTMTFRRDPRATDLTYNLQTSTDLIHWTTIAQSLAGATPTGSALVSDTAITNEPPIKLTTATQTVSGTFAHTFVRMQIVRQAP